MDNLNNSPRRAQRKNLRALCGKTKKLTTESTEKHREKTSVPLRALCGKQITHHRERRETQRKNLRAPRALCGKNNKFTTESTENTEKNATHHQTRTDQKANGQ
jgi:hypothetical protein